MINNTQERFKDKVVLISGSSSGIGKAASISFAQQGAKIILASRNKEANEMLVTQIKDLGGEALFIQADFSRTEDIKTVIHTGVKHFGGIDIAINNAGIEGKDIESMIRMGFYDTSNFL